MCQSEIPIGAVQRAHGIEFTQYFADVLRRLESLQDDDLVWIEPERIVVTPHGRRLLRVIAMCFDAYLQPRAAPNGLSLAGQRLVRRRAQYLQCVFDALVDSASSRTSGSARPEVRSPKVLRDPVPPNPSSGTGSGSPPPGRSPRFWLPASAPAGGGTSGPTASAPERVRARPSRAPPVSTRRIDLIQIKRLQGRDF